MRVYVSVSAGEGWWVEGGGGWGRVGGRNGALTAQSGPAL